MTPQGRARCLVPYVDLFNHRPESPKEARMTDELLQRALRKAFTKGSEEGINDGEWAGAEPWQVVGPDPEDLEPRPIPFPLGGAMLLRRAELVAAGGLGVGNKRRGSLPF